MAASVVNKSGVVTRASDHAVTPPKAHSASGSLNVVDRQFLDAALEIRGLAVAVEERQPIRKAFERAEATLASLPLSPHDFVVVRGRLRHAKRLVWHGELSSASTELKLVADCLYADGAI